MFAIKSVTVLFFMIILVSVSDCLRRIKDGAELTVDRKYMVYLVKAPISEVGYDNWLCGGAIVSSDFVITSAACVNDVDYLYIIAGYKKYVNDADIETDPCTASMKKKVIFTCSPTGYDLRYGEIDYWSFIDIALVQVESPFDFDDANYETLCSYKPITIAINYEERYQEPGTDALVLGWGHTEKWRKPGDKTNYNQEYIRYAPILLLNKTMCMERYKDYKNMSWVIKTYMICSLGKGNVDDAGNSIQQSLPFQSGCTNAQEKVLGFEGVSCEQKSTEDESYDDYDDGNTRRHGKTKGKTKHKPKNTTKSKTKNKNKTRIFSRSDSNKTHGRRSGICQNDHGGPIVTWAGANEILIGVASVFKVSEDYECMGPYLYTSTLCTGLFLDCILNTDFNERRSERQYLCDRPASERGYATNERTISWKKHPAGPAENEKHEKYSTNNNNQPPKPSYVEDARNHEGMKPPSNTMFQADKHPEIAIFAHEDRFETKGRNPEIKSSTVQENVLVNIRLQDNIFKSNNKYSGNQNRGIVSYAGKEMDTNRNVENKSISEEESFPVNDRYSDIKRSQDNVSNPANIRYSTNVKYPVNQRHPVIRSELPEHRQVQAMRQLQPLRN